MQKLSFKTTDMLVIVLAATSMVATLPGRTVGLGLITEPLIADLGISRVHYATLTFWATILGSLFSLPAGAAVDRFGARWTLASAVMAMAVTAVLMGWLVGSASLLLFLILSRGFGQGSLSTASVTSLGKWFTERLSIALGIFSALLAVGFAIVIPTFGAMTSSGSWRNQWMTLGGVLIVLSAVVAIAYPRGAKRNGEVAPNTWGSDWPEAIRTPVFWTFSLSIALYYLVLSGLTLFCEDVLAELGFDRSVFISAMAAMMGAGLIGNFLSGWLAQKYSVVRLLSLSLLLLAWVLLGFPYLTSPGLVIFHFVIYGVCGGAFAVLFFTGYERAFGKMHLGRIQGIAQAIGVISSAAGPVLLAQVREGQGSYLPVFRWLGPIALAFAFVAWWTWMPTASQKPKI